MTTIEREEVPVYVSDDIARDSNVIGIESEYLISQGINPLSQEVWTNYSHVERHDVFSDDFTFKACLKSGAKGGVNICQKIQTVLLFEGIAMIIPLSNIGCVADLNLYIPGTNSKGYADDLSLFGASSENWNELMVTSRNNNLFIYLNNKEIKNLKFENPTKRLIGFRFRHQGGGWLRDISLNGKQIL